MYEQKLKHRDSLLPFIFSFVRSNHEHDVCTPLQHPFVANQSAFCVPETLINLLVTIDLTSASDSQRRRVFRHCHDFCNVQSHYETVGIFLKMISLVIFRFPSSRFRTMPTFLITSDNTLTVTLIACDQRLFSGWGHRGGHQCQMFRISKMK